MNKENKLVNEHSYIWVLINTRIIPILGYDEVKQRI